MWRQQHDRERRGRAQVPAELPAVGIPGGTDSPSIPSVAMAYGETRGSIGGLKYRGVQQHGDGHLSRDGCRYAQARPKSDLSQNGLSQNGYGCDDLS